MINIKLMPALCLDLDGTVRMSKDGPDKFISGPDDIVLMEGMEKLIRRYKEMGYVIIAVSNQGGVAHGFKTPVQVEQELAATFALFKYGNPFHMVKICYHESKGTVAPYNHRSLLRKPDIGMLAAAEMTAHELGIQIDWDKSLMVGDRPEDEECAKNARIAYRDIQHFLHQPHEFVINSAPKLN